jgi:UDP-sulfoquinovose synthase
MRILVLGFDGYIGWPLTLHLLEKGYEVAVLDDYSRRERVSAIDSDSLTPIGSISDRREILKRFRDFINEKAHFGLHEGGHLIKSLLKEIKPDVIVHLAEISSAPWSMKSSYLAAATQRENVIGTLNLLWAMKEHWPDAHLIKLGSMGEYGTPDCVIPEGEIPEYCTFSLGQMCSMHGLPFPRSPNSFYHLSKVHDTYNIIFACKNWGLTSTDIMQGVVFGLADTYEPLLTRFDYDEYFGTVINRFCAQAIIGHPLTVYGKGGQTRGFLTLNDSIQCLTIAIENPPEAGEYRTLNQFENIYTINRLADMVVKAGESLGLKVKISHLKRPRIELDEHYYNPTHRKLFDLGYEPTTDIQNEVTNLIKTLLPYRDRVIEDVILPTTKWS